MKHHRLHVKPFKLQASSHTQAEEAPSSWVRKLRSFKSLSSQAQCLELDRMPERVRYQVFKPITYDVSVGEPLIALQALHELGILNGERGVVRRIHPRKPTLSLQLTSGRIITLHLNHPSHCHWHYGYAIPFERYQRLYGAESRSLVNLTHPLQQIIWVAPNSASRLQAQCHTLLQHHGVTVHGVLSHGFIS